MMELIDVLIVEDETSIADVHSFYLKQTARFRPVGVAQSINERAIWCAFSNLN